MEYKQYSRRKEANIDSKVKELETKLKKEGRLGELAGEVSPFTIPGQGYLPIAHATVIYRRQSWLKNSNKRTKSLWASQCSPRHEIVMIWCFLIVQAKLDAKKQRILEGQLTLDAKQEQQNETIRLFKIAKEKEKRVR